MSKVEHLLINDPHDSFCLFSVTFFSFKFWILKLYICKKLFLALAKWLQSHTYETESELNHLDTLVLDLATHDFCISLTRCEFKNKFWDDEREIAVLDKIFIHKIRRQRGFCARLCLFSRESEWKPRELFCWALSVCESSTKKNPQMWHFCKSSFLVFC